MPKGKLLGDKVVTDHTAFYDRSRYGTLQDGRVHLSLYEALYLLEKNKIDIIDGRKQSMDVERFLRRARRKSKAFPLKYTVFRDLRSKGYVVKTALKFGADFRVYDKGIKPGEDHAKWIVFAVHETETLQWHEFAAKNRVAHSTRKRLLIAVVDEEEDVTYFQVEWQRP